MVFWHAVKEAGLLEEVVEDFQREVQEVLKGLQERVSDPPVEVQGQKHTHLLLHLLGDELSDVSPRCALFIRCCSAQQHSAELRHAGPGEKGSGQPQEPDGPVQRAVHTQPRRLVII